MKALHTWLPALVLACAGCTGVAGGGNGDGVGGADSSAGSPGTGGLASSTAGNAGVGNGAGAGSGGAGSQGGPVLQVAPTWRLTNAEYANTVQTLLGFTPSAPLDPDGARAGFSAGLVASDATVIAYHSAAIEIAAKAAAMPSVVPCDATAISATPALCASKLIDSLAPKAFRRPVDAETKAALNALFVTVSQKYSFADGIQAVLEQLLQSPYFLYHLELEEQARGVGKVTVTSYSMASRLSYLIWSSMPDDTLFQEAAAGQLETPEQIKAQAIRMLADNRAKIGLRNFYEQWLKIGNLPVSKTGKYASAYTAATQASIRASFDAQVDAALWSPSGGLTALLNGKQAFVDQVTAPIFGVKGITGSALQAVTVDSTQRAGILMHPAIMATFAKENGTHPIKRGVFVWDQILCQDLPDPPSNIPSFPPLPPDSSVRQAYDTFTSPPTCRACHVRINPIGFLFENYDTMGAYQTTDDNGKTVDSSVTVAGAQNLDHTPDTKLNVPMTSAVQLANALAAEPELTNQCLVTKLYRYTNKRLDGAADKPIITALAGSFASTAQNIPQLLTGLTQTEAFLNRLNEQ